MTKYYLCGPISLGGTLGEEQVRKNIDKFRELGAKLHRNPNNVVFNPANLPKQLKWEDYMRLTIPMVCEADSIILLNGWEKSKGAIVELEIAFHLGKRIIFEHNLSLYSFDNNAQTAKEYDNQELHEQIVKDVTDLHPVEVISNREMRIPLLLQGEKDRRNELMNPHQKKMHQVELIMASLDDDDCARILQLAREIERQK